LQENEVSARVGQKRVFQRALINRSSFRQFSDAASPSKETEVLKQLANIIDPDLGQDIVSLGFIKNLKIAGGTVTFDLELTTPACPVKDQFKKDAEMYLRELNWVTEVKLTLTAQHKKSGPLGGKGKNAGCPGLKQVKRIIAVSSAKGGVGKSTVAVNLAYSIAKLGGKVGIFDADIFGPSLPTMVSIEDPKVGLSKDNDAMLAPLEYEGVSLMSYGFTAQALKSQASIMRGPKVASTVHQLLAFTDWGELDYLILDFPPGTGDIQLTICQEASLDGAVIITTPQKLSFVDVVRGIEMFDNLSVPVVGLVENMAYFDCGCGQRHFPFGPGHREQLEREYGTPHGFIVPIAGDISRGSDSGKPVALLPEGECEELKKIYADLAAAVVQEVSKQSEKPELPPMVEYDDKTDKVIIRPSEGEPVLWDPKELRTRCTCAKCQSCAPGTDTKRPPPPPPAECWPTAIDSKGRYAIQITWNDKHQSIFPYKLLKNMQ